MKRQAPEGASRAAQPLRRRRESERDFPAGAKREPESERHYGVAEPGARATAAGSHRRGGLRSERGGPRQTDYESGRRRPWYYGERDYDEPRRESYGDYARGGRRRA